MKVGIFITARLGSTRLEKKHLLLIKNKPIIYYLIQRIHKEFSKEIENGILKIVIATSDEVENRQFESLRALGIDIFYGSKNNIPLRHYQAAVTYKLDAVISIDGDDILCSTKGMRELYTALKQNIQYAKTSGLPFGMNSTGYTTTFLAEALKSHESETLETGWSRIFDENLVKDIKIPFIFQDESLRFTLDYEEDYEFFKMLIEKCGDDIFQMSDEEIVEVVLKEKIYNLNETISKQYWDNFYKLQKEEIEKSKNA